MFIAGLVISYGISDSLQPVVSLNHGALKSKRISVFLILSTASVFVVGIAISTLLVLNPQAVTNLFINSGEKATIQLTNHFISRIWPVFIINGVNIVLAAYLMAMHKCLDSSLIILARNLFLPALFLFIIHIMIGLDAILVVLPLSELVTFLISIFLIHKHSPKNLIAKATQLRMSAA